MSRRYYFYVTNIRLRNEYFQLPCYRSLTQSEYSGPQEVTKKAPEEEGLEEKLKAPDEDHVPVSKTLLAAPEDL